MKVIKFSLEEGESCFITLAHMFSNIEARKEYNNLQLDNKFEYPSKDLDVISSIITRYADDENILHNFEVVKELKKCDRYSEIMDYVFNPISEPYYKAFIEKVKGNIDKLDDIPLIHYEDSKQAFMSYVGGNLRALINSTDKYKFVKWNGEAWERITDEESGIIYDDFIEKCKIELDRASFELEKADYSKVRKKVHGWDNTNRTKEALNKIKRSRQCTINLENYNKNNNIICSKNGMVIDLNTGEIKPSCREDLILDVSKYNLVNKEQANSFMKEKVLKIYENILGNDRLNYILDLLAYKLLGKHLQKSIFLIGVGATGKSNFKNIAKNLFETDFTTLNYAYLTVCHKGNDDTSRDDYLVSLDNKLIGWASESDDDKGYAINQARFKKILSNSDEDARATGKGMQNVNLQRLDLFVDTNEIPIFTNIDDAVSRRLLFIRFLNKIPAEQRNAEYFNEVVKPNFDYVFSYFIYRAIGMIGKKPIEPKCVIEDTINIQSQIDSLLKFSKEIITPADGFYIECDELEKAYIKLCNDEDLPSVIKEDKLGKPAGYKEFAKRLKEYEGYKNVDCDRYSRQKIYVYRNIALKDTSEQQNIFDK